MILDVKIESGMCYLFVSNLRLVSNGAFGSTKAFRKEIDLYCCYEREERDAKEIQETENETKGSSSGNNSLRLSY